MKYVDWNATHYFYMYCGSMCCIALLYLPMIPIYIFMRDWSKAKDVSMMEFLENEEGYGHWYLYPIISWFSFGSCMLERMAIKDVSRGGFEAVTTDHRWCKDEGGGLFYWDQMYLRPDDADA